MAEILSEDPYVPNDVFFDKGKLECMILSGSNAGGKSSLARMTALLVVMAQIGCYVPAESCTLGVFDAVFTRVGAISWFDTMEANSTNNARWAPATISLEAEAPSW